MIAFSLFGKAKLLVYFGLFVNISMGRRHRGSVELEGLPMTARTTSLIV